MSLDGMNKIFTLGSIDALQVSEQEAIDAAVESGLAAFVVDCDRARSCSAVLRAVVKATDYPEYFGSDMEALYDSLCDTLMDQKLGMLLWFRRLHSGDKALVDDAQEIAAVCQDVVDFASDNERVFAYAIDHAGAHPDPEPGIDPTPYSGHSAQ